MLSTCQVISGLQMLGRLGKQCMLLLASVIAKAQSGTSLDRAEMTCGEDQEKPVEDNAFVVLRGFNRPAKADRQRQEDVKDYQPCLGFMDGRKCMDGWRADGATSNLFVSVCEMPARDKDAAVPSGSCQVLMCEPKLRYVTFIPHHTTIFLQRAGRVLKNVRDCLFVPSRNTRHFVSGLFCEPALIMQRRLAFSFQTCKKNHRHARQADARCVVVQLQHGLVFVPRYCF